MNYALFCENVDQLINISDIGCVCYVVFLLHVVYEFQKKKATHGLITGAYFFTCFFNEKCFNLNKNMNLVFFLTDNFNLLEKMIGTRCINYNGRILIFLL